MSQLTIKQLTADTLVTVTTRRGYRWKGAVVGRVFGSVSKVLVRDIERGPGYDHVSGTYKGFSTTQGWCRGENKDFGTEHICHKNQLELCDTED